MSSYMGTGSFEGWLKRIFVNMALERIRKNKDFIRSLDDVQELADIEDEPDVSDITEFQLLQIIRELPRGYQAVFNLYAIENFTHREISEMLNISEGTSRSQYNRARQILQTKVTAFFQKQEN